MDIYKTTKDCAFFGMSFNKYYFTIVYVLYLLIPYIYNINYILTNSNYLLNYFKYNNYHCIRCGNN